MNRTTTKIRTWQAMGSVGVVLVLLGGVVGPPQAAADTPHWASPAARDMVAASLAAMRASLHQVHGTLTETAGQRGKTAKLDYTADCGYGPTQPLQAQFRASGTRFSNTALERYDARFVIVNGHTWERSTRTRHRWHRDDSSWDALAFYPLCPALPQFASPDMAPDVAFDIARMGNLRNLGAVQVGRYRTWHLQSVVTWNQVIYGQGRSSGRRRIDLFIDQSSQFLVRVVSDFRNIGGDKTSSWSSTERTFSRFNQPIMIQEPRAGTFSRLAFRDRLLARMRFGS